MDQLDETISNNKNQFDSICAKMKKLLVKKQYLSTRPPQCVYPRLFISNYCFAIDK